MKTKRAAAEIGLVKALVLAVVLATAARAGLAYLPLTGPPQLRVLAVKTFQPVSAPIYETTAAHSETNNLSPLAIAAANTNHAASVITAAPDNLPPIVMSTDAALDSVLGTPIFALTTPDLMGITPQMLATYFHPVGLGTNGVEVVAPFRVGFVPPLLPEKSSHAEYIVK